MRLVDHHIAVNNNNSHWTFQFLLRFAEQHRIMKNKTSQHVASSHIYFYTIFGYFLKIEITRQAGHHHQ